LVALPFGLLLLDPNNSKHCPIFQSEEKERKNRLLKREDHKENSPRVVYHLHRLKKNKSTKFFTKQSTKLLHIALKFSENGMFNN